MILDRILAHKLQEVHAAKARVPQHLLEQRCGELPACRGFEQRLRQVGATDTAIIAEVKKGSPSKGIIRSDFDPLEIARGYAEAGAACLSVLTDEKFFLGSLKNLEVISGSVTLPLLRKDFILDPYQIYEARLHGADAVLLIAAALEKSHLRAYHRLAQELGMDVLVEVHNRTELDMALELPCSMLGINNRCLDTFVTDLNVTENLIAHISADILVVSESGINTRSDIEYLQDVGAGAFLVGESLMREQDYKAKLRALRGDATASRRAEYGSAGRAG